MSAAAFHRLHVGAITGAGHAVMPCRPCGNGNAYPVIIHNDRALALRARRPRAAAARRAARIVKLIDHAKSTDAAHGCSTLLKGEEAAIGATASPTTRVLGAPSSIIAGQAIFTASPLPISFIAERILCRGDVRP